MPRLLRQPGSHEPRPHAGGVAPILDGDALERLRRLVEQTPDATLETLHALQKLGLPRKKKSPHALERDIPEVQEARREFAEEVEPIAPKRFVFADETGVTTAMAPAQGRTPKGERVESSAPASWESPAVFEAIERADASVSALPPYSPDFSLIEEKFSKFKESLRRVGARAKEHLHGVIGEGPREVTLPDILGWFRHTGACVMRA